MDEQRRLLVMRYCRAADETMRLAFRAFAFSVLGKSESAIRQAERDVNHQLAVEAEAAAKLCSGGHG